MIGIASNYKEWLESISYIFSIDCPPDWSLVDIEEIHTQGKILMIAPVALIDNEVLLQAYSRVFLTKEDMMENLKHFKGLYMLVRAAEDRYIIRGALAE